VFGLATFRSKATCTLHFRDGRARGDGLAIPVAAFLLIILDPSLSALL
jgi:hypothetical protein